MIFVTIVSPIDLLFFIITAEGTINTTMSIEFAKLRSWDDFIMKSARFGPVDFKNLPRWNNRIVNNLLYYQSNYFLSTLVVLAICVLFNPYSTVIGFGVIAAQIMVYFIGYRQYIVEQEMIENSNAVKGALIGAVLLVNYLFQQEILFSVFYLLLSVFSWMLHASFRLRNLKNKTANYLGSMKKTPMGILLLDTLAIEVNVDE